MNTPAEASEADGGEAQQAITVLIAEDDPAMRAALAELFRFTDGLDVVGAVGNVAGAVSSAVELNPDVAIIDVRMPGGGGPRAARLIREQAPRTRIVAFSAYADRAAVLEMLSAGAVEYAVKGTDADALIDAVRRTGRGRVNLPPGEIDELIGDLAALILTSETETRSLSNRLADALVAAEIATAALRSRPELARAPEVADLDELFAMMRSISQDLAAVVARSALEHRQDLVTGGVL